MDTRKELLSEARYQRIGLRAAVVRFFEGRDFGSWESPDWMSIQAVWLHRHALRFRAAQLALARVRRELSVRVAFLRAAQEVTGEPMVESYYSPLGWHHYGQLTTTRRQRQEWREGREQDKAATKERK